MALPYISIALGLYLLLLVLALAFSDRLMFPIRRCTYADTSQIIKLTTTDGTKISAVYLPIPNAKYTILFSHGNGEDLGVSKFFYRLLHECGFSVFAYDYHGYGTSDGKPTERNVYLDIQAAYDYMVHILHIPPSRIICHGRSIGGGPSVDLAAKEPIGGLILESCFVTVFRVVTWARLLPCDKFCNANKLPKVQCPILVIHARNDCVVPFWHGKRLYCCAPQPKMHLWAKTGGHNSLVAGAGYQYQQTLREFARMIDHQQEAALIRFDE